MSKRPYGETAARVLAAHAKHRCLSSVELGKILGLHPAYVRKVLYRNGLSLAMTRDSKAEGRS